MNGGHEHEVALAALPYLPVVVVTSQVALDIAARAGSATAVRLRSACVSTTPRVLLGQRKCTGGLAR
jgi:hypothetical protein